VDEEEFTRLFGIYRLSVYRIAYCQLRNAADAEDVTQEVFLKLYTSPPRYADDAQAKAWLIRVAINRCRDLQRSRRYRQYEELSEELAASAPEEERLLAVIGQLKPKLRCVMFMYYYEEYSVKEIAALLKVTQSAVTTRLMRGRTELRALLEKEGL